MAIILGEIIAIGSELLIGGRPETNSLFLAEQLAENGVQVRWKTIVGDVEKDIAFSLKQAMKRARVVILTGGLGSTVDDRTRHVIAKVTRRPLRRRPKALAFLKSWYKSRGKLLTPALASQADIPIKAVMLANPVGSAPGIWIDCRRSILIALPGVSLEAKAMFQEQVLPRLGRYLNKTHVMKQKIFHTFGLTESEIDEQLKPVMKQFPSIQLGLLASSQGVTVTLTGWHAAIPPRKPLNDTQNLALLQSAASLVRSHLRQFVYGEDRQTMEEVIGEYLRSHSLTLAVAESCTGGLIGHRLTQVPGSSSYLDRVVVCYSNQAKQDLLGVSPEVLRRHGAVSAPVARAMARGIRKQNQAVFGLAVTGIAGPGGGSKQKPVGLVFVGLDWPDGTTVCQFHFHGDRPTIKMRASQAALDVLRGQLLQKP